jgi:hypothetical protein
MIAFIDAHRCEYGVESIPDSNAEIYGKPGRFR